MKGQALVTLLFFTIFAITVTTAAVVVVVANSKSGVKFQEGSVAFQVAQSGADNAVIRLLRDPGYTGETDLQVGKGLADISVIGSGIIADPYIIISTGKVGDFVKTIEVTVTYEENEMEVISQKEVFN